MMLFFEDEMCPFRVNLKGTKIKMLLVEQVGYTQKDENKERSHGDLGPEMKMS